MLLVGANILPQSWQATSGRGLGAPDFFSARAFFALMRSFSLPSALRQSAEQYFDARLVTIMPEQYLHLGCGVGLPASANSIMAMGQSGVQGWCGTV